MAWVRAGKARPFLWGRHSPFKPLLPGSPAPSHRRTGRWSSPVQCLATFFVGNSFSHPFSVLGLENLKWDGGYPSGYFVGCRLKNQDHSPFQCCRA